MLSVYRLDLLRKLDEFGYVAPVLFMEAMKDIVN